MMKINTKLDIDLSSGHTGSGVDENKYKTPFQICGLFKSRIF